MTSNWTICLDDAKRIERDGEVVAWLYERKWELLLVALASAEGRPVYRQPLADALHPGNPKGRDRLSETTHALRAHLAGMGAPDDSVISDRPAIRLGPGLSVRKLEPDSESDESAD